MGCGGSKAREPQPPLAENASLQSSTTAPAVEEREEAAADGDANDEAKAETPKAQGKRRYSFAISSSDGD